jgi:hypothetical protein
MYSLKMLGGGGALESFKNIGGLYSGLGLFIKLKISIKILLDSVFK